MVEAVAMVATDSTMGVRAMAVDDGRSLWVAKAIVLGAGTGLTFGVALGGTTFIAPGIVVGAGIGVVIGAVAAARRPPVPK